jgi:hypothetical protein
LPRRNAVFTWGLRPPKGQSPNEGRSPPLNSHPTARRSLASRTAAKPLRMPSRASPHVGRQARCAKPSLASRTAAKPADAQAELRLTYGGEAAADAKRSLASRTAAKPLRSQAEPRLTYGGEAAAEPSRASPHVRRREPLRSPAEPRLTYGDAKPLRMPSGAPRLTYGSASRCGARRSLASRTAASRCGARPSLASRRATKPAAPGRASPHVRRRAAAEPGRARLTYGSASCCGCQAEPRLTYGSAKPLRMTSGASPHVWWRSRCGLTFAVNSCVVAPRHCFLG